MGTIYDVRQKTKCMPSILIDSDELEHMDT